MRLEQARKDLYRRLAKEQGYKSRAAFKLIQANEKYEFIRNGARVVDFGSAPGGWLQVSSELVGPRGKVVGVDLHAVHLKEKNVTCLKLDVYEPGAPGRILDELGGKADVVLSDLAPSVSGVWELDNTRQADLNLRVLELSGPLLREGGDGFFKVFEGERSQEVREALKGSFTSIRPIKPAASRNASSELYYYCMGWRAEKEN